MKTLLASVLAAAAAVALAPPVAAQPAMALGHPLPDAKLDTGTISVRVIAGSSANNVIGTDVTLIVNGTPRKARTDDTGHAKFPGLPPGALVQARVLDADKKEVMSDQFTVPETGGAAVMLTTKPFGGGGMPGGGRAAPVANGAGGMPEPRALSGEPRPEPADPSGTITVRLTYDDFKAAPPVGVPVTLVAYSYDDKITVTVVASDKDGRAAFSGLDRSGGTSYFAMTELPRNNAIDRLYSIPVELTSTSGVRVLLSAEKRDSTAKPVDDLGKLEKQEDLPGGKVRVTLAGVPVDGEPVTLVDAATGKPVASVKSGVAEPDPAHVQVQSQFEALANAQLGTLAIIVHGGAGNADAPLDGISVKVVAEGADAPVEAKTASGGNAMFLLKPGAKGIATITINGKPFDSKPFDLPATGGGGIELVAHWEAQGQPQAVFDVPYVAGQVVYAETTMHHQTNRSLPFQLVERSGTHVTVYVLPRVMATYRLGAEVEDQMLGVQGRFTLSNNAWAPYRGGPDGIILPAPKGFRGGVVAEMDQADVAVAPDEGFRIIRPLAPGQKQFHAGFSIPVDAGSVSWKMDLPFGAFESGIQIRALPHMIVTPPLGFAVDTRKAQDNSDAFVIDHAETDTGGNGITIMPNTQMLISIEGLPAPPSWARWAPRFLGIAVVATMLAGLGFALRRREHTAADPNRSKRREKLMTELVDLERSGKDPVRRETLLVELERLWVDD